MIKKGDLLDIYDTQGCWVIATVLAVNEAEDRPREVQVGYRVYCENGAKTDVAGHKFEGWSESFDEDIPVSSLRVQKAYSITKLGVEYCRKISYDESQAPDDSTDVLINVLSCSHHACLRSVLRKTTNST